MKNSKELPKGWRWGRLGDVCEFLDHRRKPVSEAERAKQNEGKREEDLYPYYGANGQAGWIDDYLFDEPLILLAEDGGAFGSADTPIAYKIEGKTWVNNHAHVLRPRDDIDFDYCLASISVRPDLANLATGNTRPKLNQSLAAGIPVLLPPLQEQRRIARMLREKMAAVEKARAAAQARLEAALALPIAFTRETLRPGQTRKYLLGDCLTEIKNGVGADWSKYPVLGATRDGLAPAKEGVGKAPERYKLVDPVTVFYNPMRILLGSIAMVDDGDATGITSPDYVVVKGRPGILETRWFYYWFRSTHGAHLIDSLSRGAVRERILFNRLAAGEIEIPDYETQLRISERMKQVRPVAESITKELQTIEALPSAILREAFVGVT